MLEMGSAPKRDGTVARMLAQGGTMQEPSDASPRILKLVDFDFTDEWEPSSPRAKAVVGTDGYIAPEAYLGDMNPKSDVFSAGVILYVLVTGYLPYDDELFDDAEGENVVGSEKMKKIYEKMLKYKVDWESKTWRRLPRAAR